MKKVSLIIPAAVIAILGIFLIISSCKKEEKQDPPSPGISHLTYEEVLVVLNSVDDHFSGQVDLYGKAKAKEELASYLKLKDDIVRYNFSADSAVVFYKLKDSTLCLYRFEYFDEIPDSLHSISVSREKLILTPTNKTIIPHNNRALLLSPHYFQWDGLLYPPDYDDLNYYFKERLESAGYEVTYKFNESNTAQDISFDDFLNWDDYGIISFVGHGAAGSLYHYINTGVIITDQLYQQYLPEINNDEVAVSSGYQPNNKSGGENRFSVSSKWFQEKLDSELDNTFILMSACESLKSVVRPFENVLIGENSLYWGWTDSYIPHLGGWSNARYMISQLLPNGGNSCDAYANMLSTNNYRHRLWNLNWTYLEMSANSDCDMSLIAVGNTPPLANFSANITNGTVPLSVSFTDQSTNNPTAWYWSFGDGEVSTQADPTHVYNTEGSYTVALTVSNAYGSNTKTETNYIAVSSGGGGNGEPCQDTPTVSDSDGNIYNTVQIGNQCWMRENLKTGTHIDVTQEMTNNSIIEKYCYDDDPANCELYGGLYQWDELMLYIIEESTQGICPSGWHIPSKEEWSVLADYTDNHGGKVKEAGYEHWLQPNTGATNETGFTALPSGRCWEYGGLANFGSIREESIFFSSTEYSSDISFTFQMYFNNPAFGNSHSYGKSNGLAVRCIKD